MKWDKSYILPFCCTKETKLQTFHFKLFYTKVAITDYLYKRGISSKDICTFCEQNTESQIYLFWDCELVQTFWQKIQHLYLVDTATDKASGLFFDPTNLPGVTLLPKLNSF